MKSQEFYQKLKFKLEPITPIHIASGSFLIENKDFYLRKGNICRLNYPKLIANIPDEDLAQTFQQIKNEGIRCFLPKPPKKEEKPKVEEDWKQVLRQKVGMNAVPEEPKEEEPETQEGCVLDQAKIYESPINFARDDIASRVQAMALESSLRSFLPGSTLKGAIRTALYVNTLLKEPQRLDRLRFTWTSNPIEADYPLDRELTGLDRRNLGKDIFCQLWVKDSNYVKAADSLDFYQLRIMNIGGDNDGQEQPNRLVWKKGSKRNVSSYREADSIYWEMIKPGTEFTTEVIIDKRRMKTEESVLEIDKQNIMQALNVFSAMIAEHEIDYAEKFQIPYLQDFYREMLENCKKAQEDGKAAYVPVGSGLPWHAKTIGNLLESSSLDKIRRHFYRYMGKFVYLPLKTSFHGLKLRRGQLGGKQVRPEKLKSVAPFPKTRHYIFIDNQPSCPPGWARLELE